MSENSENGLLKYFDKVRLAVCDAAQIGSGELSRSVHEVKTRVSRYQITRKRKELFSDLGLAVYDMISTSPIDFVKTLKSQKHIQVILDTLESLEEMKNFEKNTFSLNENFSDPVAPKKSEKSNGKKTKFINKKAKMTQRSEI